MSRFRCSFDITREQEQASHGLSSLDLAGKCSVSACTRRDCAGRHHVAFYIHSLHWPTQRTPSRHTSSTLPSPRWLRNECILRREIVIYNVMFLTYDRLYSLLAWVRPACTTDTENNPVFWVSVPVPDLADPGPPTGRTDVSTITHTAALNLRAPRWWQIHMSHCVQVFTCVLVCVVMAGVPRADLSVCNGSAAAHVRLRNT